MSSKDSFILYENNDEFNYNNNNKTIQIKFNRVAFIFLFFLLFH